MISAPGTDAEAALKRARSQHGKQFSRISSPRSCNQSLHSIPRLRKVFCPLAACAKTHGANPNTSSDSESRRTKPLRNLLQFSKRLAFITFPCLPCWLLLVDLPLGQTVHSLPKKQAPVEIAVALVETAAVAAVVSRDAVAAQAAARAVSLASCTRDPESPPGVSSGASHLRSPLRSQESPDGYNRPHLPESQDVSSHHLAAGCTRC